MCFLFLDFYFLLIQFLHFLLPEIKIHGFRKKDKKCKKKLSIRQFRHKEGKKFEEKQETGSKEYPRLGFNKNFSEKAEKIYV